MLRYYARTSLQVLLSAPSPKKANLLSSFFLFRCCTWKYNSPNVKAQEAIALPLLLRKNIDCRIATTHLVILHWIWVIIIQYQCEVELIVVGGLWIIVLLRGFFALGFEFRLTLFDEFRPIDVLVLRATMPVALPCVRASRTIASERRLTLC